MRELYLAQLYQIIQLLFGKQINDGYHYLENPVPEAFIHAGIYFFFDPNINRANGQNKIIRIGKTGNNHNNRLNLHRNGTIDNSVFRRHVNSALQNNGQAHDEQAINTYIRPLPYLFLPINNDDHLDLIERRMIKLVSNRDQPVQFDVPPANWLGYHATNPAIGESHLWNVHHVGGYTEHNHEVYAEVLNLMHQYVDLLP